MQRWKLELIAVMSLSGVGCAFEGDEAGAAAEPEAEVGVVSEALRVDSKIYPLNKLKLNTAYPLDEGGYYFVDKIGSADRPTGVVLGIHDSSGFTWEAHGTLVMNCSGGGVNNQYSVPLPKNGDTDVTRTCNQPQTLRTPILLPTSFLQLSRNR